MTRDDDNKLIKSLILIKKKWMQSGVYVRLRKDDEYLFAGWVSSFFTVHRKGQQNTKKVLSQLRLSKLICTSNMTHRKLALIRIIDIQMIKRFSIFFITDRIFFYYA